MPSKESEKNAPFADIASEIDIISISNNSQLKPFSESFSYSPANVIQQPLGDIFGFFKISDRSDDSAYIVNFLTAVIKKEYYINPRRSPEDSFDAALNKVNVALSEIARNGNINWLGKLEAAAGTVYHRNFLFTVSGNARVLLFRRGILNDISENLAEKEEIHPLKTFINVSSGQLKAGDKLIITSDDIFRVLSFFEIQKSALRFPAQKFSQFIHTALVNRLDSVETIIIDVSEKENLKKKKAKSKEPEEKLINVFSQKAFQKPAYSSSFHSAVKTKSKKDYTDKKTGHIYVHGEEEKGKRKSPAYLFFFALKEKLNDFLYRLAGGIKNKASYFRKKWENARFKKETDKKEIAAAKAEAAADKKEVFPVKAALPQILQIKKGFYQITGKLKGAFYKTGDLFPRFSKMKGAFLSLDYKRRILGIAVLTAIIIFPLAAIKIKNRSAPSPVPEAVITENKRVVLAEDKNISLNVRPEMIEDTEEIFATEILDEIYFFISPQKIIQREKNGEQKSFDIPNNYGKIVLTAPMKDLNLIFLLTDQDKTISFSPVSREFKENKISLPENSRIRAMAAYLTYLYLTDASNNKIYRYPRAEGGFGTGVSWLKEEIDLDNVSDIAVDENIYLAEENKMIKLFKGKTAESNLESSTTPIEFNKVFTDISTANIYILNSTNGRVVKFSKSGEIISQYYNETLEGALDLAVDEKNNKAFITTSSGGVISLEL